MQETGLNLRVLSSSQWLAENRGRAGMVDKVDGDS